MNFDQFTASFRNPEGTEPCEEQPVQNPVREVLIVGTVLSATKELCCIEINGVRYEIAGRDIIEIGDVIPAAATQTAEKKEEAGQAYVSSGPRLVMIKLRADAILQTRVRVPAALIAAVGTWVRVVPQAAKAA
jgi:hypothetical protein